MYVLRRLRRRTQRAAKNKKRQDPDETESDQSYEAEDQDEEVDKAYSQAELENMMKKASRIAMDEVGLTSLASLYE
ncbi:unnamed protein product [Soboliphyme baturini]|uniref:Uncharacterized protein n=1 Tax=Soboliphyme baturini TaxID=241478 RepID=A0A3P8EPI6_9BILA|nr:unnamed protein product [Soboliphyme baturini]